MCVAYTDNMSNTNTATIVQLFLGEPKRAVDVTSADELRAKLAEWRNLGSGWGARVIVTDAAEKLLEAAGGYIAVDGEYVLDGEVVS